MNKWANVLTLLQRTDYSHLNEAEMQALSQINLTDLPTWNGTIRQLTKLNVGKSSNWEDLKLVDMTQEITELGLAKLSLRRVIAGDTRTVKVTKRGGRDRVAQDLLPALTNYANDLRKNLDIDKLSPLDQSAQKKFLLTLNQLVIANRWDVMKWYRDVCNYKQFDNKDGEKGPVTFQAMKMGYFKSFKKVAYPHHDYLDIFVKNLELAYKAYQREEREKPNVFTRSKQDFRVLVQQLWGQSMQMSPKDLRIVQVDRQVHILLENAKLEREQVNKMIDEMRTLKKGGTLILGQGAIDAPAIRSLGK